MPQFTTFRAAPLLVAAVIAAGSITACNRPVEYGDVVYGDRHRWDSREDAAYRRWEAERRFDHLEFTRRPAEEQSAYWTWRHAHP